MFENVLFLEKRGCNFWDDSPESRASDVGNYRVCTHGESVPMKNGGKYFFEFSLWRDRKQERKTHKVTGKPLKHPKMETINPFALAINTEFSRDGGSWRDCAMETQLYEKNYSYTLHDILEVINGVSTATYNKVIFAPEEAIKAVPHILKIAGYREKEILENLAAVTMVQCDKNYTVYQFSSGEKSFSYEARSRRISG